MAFASVALLILIALTLWSRRLSSEEHELAADPMLHAHLEPAAPAFDAQGKVSLEDVGPRLVMAAERSPSIPENDSLEAATGSLARFRVTDGLSGAPMAGVKLHAGGEYLVGKSELGDVPSGRAFLADPVRVAREQLPVYTTDSQGIVEVPGSTAEGIVAAVSLPGTESSHALEAWVNPTSKQLRNAKGQPFPLVLRARQTWSVRAVDRSGQGRDGVEIKAQPLRSRDLEEILKEGGPRGFPAAVPSPNAWTLTLGTTSAGGRLTYAGSPLLEAAKTDGDPVVAVLLAAILPGEEALPVLLRETQRLGSLIDLPMPPSAEVTARLLNHQGRPLLGWHALSVARLTEEGSADLMRVLVPDGNSVLGPLPTRSRLWLQLDSDDGPGIEVVSPDVDGSRMVAEVRAGSKHAVLFGRLLDGEGRAHANRSIEASGAGWTAHCEGTDQAGQFSLVVPLRNDRGLQQSAVIRLGDSEYRVRLQGPLEARTYELGTLSPSAPRPLLVAGRVVTPLKSECSDFDAYVETCGAGGTWHELQGVETSTSNDGRFSIHGDSEPGVKYRLFVAMRGACFLSVDPINFVPGSTDLSVELESASALTVRVATPLTVGSGRSLLRALDLVLDATSGEAAQTGRDALEVEKLGNVNADGLVSLQWSGLPPGTYRLSARARGTDTVLATMPNLAASRRGDTAPPVLDLQGALRPFHLRIVGPDGAPLGHARTTLRWMSDSDRSTMDLRGASCRGIAPNLPVEVLARVTGYVSVRQPLRAGAQEIVMQPVTMLTTQVRVTGLDLPDGVQAELAWGPAILKRDVRQVSCFEVSADLAQATDELRIGRQPVGSGLSIAIQQPARPGPMEGLRVMLVLSAPPVQGRPGLPTKVLLDEMPGWVLPNPQASTATLSVDSQSLEAALTAMGHPR